MSSDGKIIPREYASPIPIPPGETLKEIIDELDMSQKELAERLGVSTRHLSFIITGKSEISREFAQKLEYVLGIDSFFWVNLENEYRCALKKMNPIGTSENEEVIAKDIPYSELAKQGYVEPTRKIDEKIRNLRSFFGVSDLNYIPKVNCAFRKANIANESELALAAWIRIAEIQAKEIKTDKFNRRKLIKSLEEIRTLTRYDASIFYKKLVDLLASCGIALVVANHIKGTGVQGVTFFNNKKNKLIIQLSVRRKYADTFWFTLFHELGHIVIDETEEFSYINCSEEEEKKVDLLAKEILIPEERYRDFLRKGMYGNYNAIEKFAEVIDIHPCIIIGRLKYDEYLPYNIFVDRIPKFVIN